MAQPARSPAELDEPPVLDPAAIEQAYRYHRARRAARLQRARATRLARLRFWVVALVLLLACLVLSVTVWEEMRQLFGI